ncbi:hypothetical protein [Ruegeria jejuensis]|uniref:hypothetical protein n=1 Tax=Ruegeria jejuensis TaxID=3233338 RepID=UPI00355C2EAD
MTRKTISATAALLAALAATSPGLAEEFSLTGSYSGLYACDSTTAGVPSSWARPMIAGIVQEGANFTMQVTYSDKLESPDAEYSLYSGKVSLSQDNNLLSGYFEACGGSFPSKELGRFFPSATDMSDFSVTIDSVWASDQVPNLPGLTVQTCRWSLTRSSGTAPDIRQCATE